MKAFIFLLSVCVGRALARTSQELAQQQLDVQNCSNSGCETMQVGVVLDKTKQIDADRDVEVQGDKLVLHNSAQPRLYLTKDGQYMKFSQFVGQEFSFDIELSNLVAGTNSALYFVDMPASEPGEGYCDAKGVDGSESCHEMDLWEGNSLSNAVTSHSCDASGCAKEGCSTNEKRRPDTYGPNQPVDTLKPFTVVTQFVGTDKLTSIRRLYRQEGNEIVGGVVGSCHDNGGFESMSSKLKSGMVLAISLSNGHENSTDLFWLDGRKAGKDADMKKAVATFSNIAFGPIGATRASGTPTQAPSTTVPTNSSKTSQPQHDDPESAVTTVPVPSTTNSKKGCKATTKDQVSL